jgi:hypothetical protein
VLINANIININKVRGARTDANGYFDWCTITYIQDFNH